jgi:membrane protein YdbS with pleckstrin-like domain
MAPADAIARHRVLRRYLLDGERVVTAVHQHWAKVAEPVASAVLGLVLALWLDSLLPASVGHAADVLWWLWILVVVRGAWRLLEWRHDWFVATDKRLILTYGVFTQKVAMMPLSKVTDMSYNRSPMGRIAGFGTFVMESAGQDQALHHVNWVPEPDHTYRAICAEIFGVDDRDRVDPGDGDDDGPATPDAGGPGAGPGAGPAGGPGAGPGGLGRPPVPPAPGSPGDWSTGIRIRPVEPGEHEQGDESGRSLYQSPDLRPRGSRDADTGPIPILRPPTDP